MADNPTPNTFVAIKEAIDKQASTFAEFTKVNDQRLEAVKSGNEALEKELGEKLGRIEADIKKYGDLKRDIEVEVQLLRDRTEELESRSSQPGKPASEKAQDEYRDVFVQWLRRKGADLELSDKLIKMERKMIERKDITVGSNPDGGYGLPKIIEQGIRDLEIKLSPVRRIIPTATVGSTDYHKLLGIRGATSGWVGETDTRTATGTPQLRDVKPTFGELYAYPQVSQWSIDDLVFDVEDWLIRNIASEFAYQEGVAVLTGNGSNKPTGMLNTTPVTTNDWASPLRAAAAYEYISCTASPVALSPDCIINLQYALNSAYRSGSYYVMNSTTTGVVRTMKDTSDQYLWQPSLQAGQPNMLAGYPVETWEDLDDVGANNFPVAFGNFNEAYLLVDRVGMRIIRDNITSPGFVKFYVSRREGGIPFNNDALKWIRTD